MEIKENIFSYLDKGDKGYISLCDCFRVLKHCALIMLLLIFPGMLSTIGSNTQFDITNIPVYVILSLIIYIGWIVGLIIVYIMWWISYKIFNNSNLNKCKSKLKLCKIKLIKLK